MERRMTRVRTSGNPCHDCGSRQGETPFPRGRRRRGEPRLCVDCTVERARVAMRDMLPVFRGYGALRVTQTRASYRAALRHREKQPQGDLVDLCVKGP
jgi:hypothetical protein